MREEKQIYKTIKLVLAFVLLLCLLNMPYGYYRFVRISAFVGFGVLAYYSLEQEDGFMATLCIGIAILFNPFLIIFFSRSTWNIIDVVIAIGLIVWVLVEILSKKSSTKRLG